MTAPDGTAVPLSEDEPLASLSGGSEVGRTCSYELGDIDAAGQQIMVAIAQQGFLEETLVHDEDTGAPISNGAAIIGLAFISYNFPCSLTESDFGCVRHGYSVDGDDLILDGEPLTLESVPDLAVGWALGGDDPTSSTFAAASLSGQHGDCVVTSITVQPGQLTEPELAEQAEDASAWVDQLVDDACR